MHIFRTHERYGVPKINIYLLRALSLDGGLPRTLGRISRPSKGRGTPGPWNPGAAAAWSVWAAFSVLAVIGLFHPFRMLPIVLLEIVYKTIWLLVAGIPLWSPDSLAGRTEEMMFSFALVAFPFVAAPWGYAFRTFFRRDRGPGLMSRAPEAGLSYEGASS